MTAEMVIQVSPPAARLKIRKGSAVTWTVGGEASEFVVAHVGYPDELGRCKVRLERTKAPASRS